MILEKEELCFHTPLFLPLEIHIDRGAVETSSPMSSTKNQTQLTADMHRKFAVMNSVLEQMKEISVCVLLKSIGSMVILKPQGDSSGTMGFLSVPRYFGIWRSLSKQRR